MKPTFSQTALALGIACAAAHLWPVISPATCGPWLRRFHRNVPVGIVLMLLGAVWFVRNLVSTDISDFAAFRPALIGGFALLGIGSCIYVRDYISVRGLAVVALLLADVVLDVQRLHPSPLKNLVTAWVYVWIVLAMWTAMSPWRARDWLAWCAATEGRLRMLGLAGLVWGLGIAALGLTVYR